MRQLLLIGLYFNIAALFCSGKSSNKINFHKSICFIATGIGVQQSKFKPCRPFGIVIYSSLAILI
jgi:hypothetical protein